MLRQLLSHFISSMEAGLLVRVTGVDDANNGQFPLEALSPELSGILRSTGRTIYRHQDLGYSKTRRRFAI
jgi:hypothetical protein